MGHSAKFLCIEPQFRVTDLVRTAEYYCNVLGFTLGGYFGDPPAFTQISRDMVTIQLGLAQDAASATRPVTGVAYNAYIFVDDVEALAAEYAQGGVTVVAGPVTRVYGCRELVIKDCNDLVLCFAQSGVTSPPDIE
jgi:predicted enzyme related to lactoylglutathione lyase